MELKRRFKYMTWAILLIPVFSILITVFAFFLTWSMARHESEDISAPRYLKPSLEEIFTTGTLEGEGFQGIIVMFGSDGRLVYADPIVSEKIIENNWNSMTEAYKGLMSEMPPSQPFNFSVYQYKGEPGIVIFVEKYFTTFKLFRILGFVIFGLYLILIVLPVLALRVFMKPLQETLIALEKAAGEIGRGNLDNELIIPISRSLLRKHPPVLKNLCNAFENMRKELKDNQERQSRVMMSVSHDLKTPLTLIKGYVEALKDGMAETPEEVVQYAEVIHDRAGLLEERISELIHYTKLQTTDWQARYEPINMCSFLDETAGIFKNDTFIRKRKFQSDIRISDDIFVRGDRKMLFQVIENVFDNSCRYTAEDDTISMTALIREEGEQSVVVVIEDSGPGVNTEHVPYIFDNFYRADQGRNARGSGMGLASAKMILRNHGGDIVYRDSTFGGAGFEIILPVVVESGYNKGDDRPSRKK